MSRLNLIAAFFGMMTGLVVGAPVVTKDPLAHIRRVYDFSGVKKMYKLTADLNHDGIAEVILAPIEPEELDSDVGWYVYIGKADGRYLRAGEAVGAKIMEDRLPSFSRRHYWVGYIPEVSKYGLLTLKSGRGGQAMCQLHALVDPRGIK